MRVDEHWAVSVYRNGELVITIESNSLCGRDLMPGDEECIRNCARHLLAFIGQTRTYLTSEVAAMLDEGPWVRAFAEEEHHEDIHG